VALHGGLGSSYVFDGRLVPGARRFRLLHQDDEARAPGDTPLVVRVFEAVPGAVLRGGAPPGRRVAASLDLSLQGRIPFTYRDAVAAGRDGRFAITVPYPSDALSGDTLPTGAWRVEVEGEGAPRAARVTERDVVEGRAVEVR
jgi:asparagine N-glycosylation enzyme membrane subunit Stt3